MSKIKARWFDVELNIDLSEAKIFTIPKAKYQQVSLSLSLPESTSTFSFADIRLHSRDLYAEAKETFEDAKLLAEEIARRWESEERNRTLLKEVLLNTGWTERGDGLWDMPDRDDFFSSSDDPLTLNDAIHINNAIVSLLLPEVEAKEGG